MKQFLFAVTSLLILSSASYGQSKWWVSADSVNIFTRNTGGVMIGGVDPLGKLTVNSDRLGFNLALVGDYNNLSKNYLKIGVLGRASNGLDGHTLFDLYHSNTTLKKAGFNFRINEKSAFFINGEGNIGIGTEKPLAGLDITSGPDWGGFKKGLRLSANNAISVESGEMKYGMVGSENALHFFATNGGEKVNPFGSAFARLMSLQPKKVVIEGDLEVKGKIIYEGGKFLGTSTVGTVTTSSSNNLKTSINQNNGVKIDALIGEGGDCWYGDYENQFMYNNRPYEYVGIGTSSPDPNVRLTIEGDNDQIKLVNGMGNMYIRGFRNQADASVGGFNLIGNGSNTGYYYFNYDGSSIMRLFGTGTVAIGSTSNPTGSKLYIKGGSSSSTSSLNITNLSGASMFYVRDDGNVGIGTTTPGSKLTITGTSDLFKLEGSSTNYLKYTLSDTNKFFTHSGTNIYFQNEGNNNQVFNIRPLGITTSSPGQWGSTLSLYYTERTNGGTQEGTGIKGGSGNATEIVYETNYYENIRLNSNGTSYFNGGNVGIGTTTPINWANLDIYNSGSTAFMRLKGVGNESNFSGINLSSDEATDKEWEIIHRNTNGGFNQKNFLSFAYYNGTVWNEWMGITPSGTVTIGTRSPGTQNHKLVVEGSIGARKIVITQTNPWPDFVFADDYKLMPLNQLEKHVKTHKHLPGIPTEKDVTSNGVDLGEVQAKLLQKVEELTLYVIEINKKIEMQDKKILEQEKIINKLTSTK